MSEITLTDDRFEPRSCVKDRLSELEMLEDPRSRTRFRLLFNTEFRAAIEEWVYGFLLSYGPSLTVLEPGNVRRILRERAAIILENYDK